MRKYTFDEVKLSHSGMLRAKEKLISKAQAAASKQGLIGKAEFAVLVAALFLYEIWFSLIVYAHLTVRRVLPGKRMTKVAIIALTVMVFFGIAAFAKGSRNNSGAGESEAVATEAGVDNGEDTEEVDDVASLQKAKAEAAEEAFDQEKAEAEAAEEKAFEEEDVADNDAETEEAVEEVASDDSKEAKEADEGEIADDAKTNDEAKATDATKKTDVSKVANAEKMTSSESNTSAPAENSASVEKDENSVEVKTQSSDSTDEEPASENAANRALAETDTDNKIESQTDRLTKLKEENSDFYGLITSADAGIDSVIMSSSSKPDKYLDKNFEGKRDKNGLPSIVDEVHGDISSIIIYAGNVDGSGKFAGILKYADGNCDGTIRIDTLEGSREFKIITGFAESEEAKDNEALKHIGDDAENGDCFLVLVTGTTEGRRFYIVAKSL